MTCRITTRFDPGYVGTSLWAVMHEAGHALYNNCIGPELERTPLCRSPSLGFDESQSRLWENWVGRGRPFLGRLLPELVRGTFPERFADLDPERLYRAANAVQAVADPGRGRRGYLQPAHPAAIRAARSPCSRNAWQPAELPEAWRERMREYLGLEVIDDADGVLQDVHWADGSFGYFPTYSIGNVIAGQLWEHARAAIGDLDEQLRAGELSGLLDFLRDLLLRHGGKFEPAEMV